MIAIRPRRHLPVLALALCALAPLALPPRAVAASNLTFTVNTTVDAPDANTGDGICADSTGQCTLRAAVQQANALPQGGAVTIVVPAGTYELPLGTLQLATNRVAISGALSSTTILSGTNIGTVLAISRAVRAAISGVTVTGGNVGPNGRGGGILNGGQTLLSHSIVSGNAGGFGAGIYDGNGSRLLVVSSSITGNVANLPGGSFDSGGGGGIYNSDGPLTVVNSTISNNPANYGGGIYISSGSVVVANSILSNNSACFCGDEGAGIATYGPLTVRNSIFSGNSGGSYGGGIYNAYSVVTVTNSTFSNNHADLGGGISNYGGTLTVANSTFRGNYVSEGGGIYSNGTLTVMNSTFSDNAASYGGGTGGGIDNYGPLTIENSTFGGNSAYYDGGGLANEGPATMTNSTMSSNAAGQQGGGIFNDANTLHMTNSTLSNNTASYGGGIFNFGPLTVLYSTLSGNAATEGGALYNGSSTATFQGTIVTGSPTGGNCDDPVPASSQGYNLDDGTTCGFNQTTDLTNTNPLLGPLAKNGGPTQTMALLPGSPAIDHGGTQANGCPATDQRGLPRPDEHTVNGPCDMGAYESQGLG